jgi:hypothetical protein
LSWQDVDWAAQKFRVDSPKTGESWVPHFPELRRHLDAAFEAAPEGAVHVITRCRDTNANLRTTFTKIIRRAELKPWPKLFHNLRASRQTELAAVYPLIPVSDDRIAVAGGGWRTGRYCTRSPSVELMSESRSHRRGERRLLSQRDPVQRRAGRPPRRRLLAPGLRRAAKPGVAVESTRTTQQFLNVVTRSMDHAVGKQV